MNKQDLYQQLVGSKTGGGSSNPVKLSSREELYNSLINANKPSASNKVTVKKTIKKPQAVKKEAPKGIVNRLTDTVKYGAERFKASFPTLAGGLKVGSGVALDSIGKTITDGAFDERNKKIKIGGKEMTVREAIGKTAPSFIPSADPDPFRRAKIALEKKTGKDLNVTKKLKESGSKDYKRAQEASQKVIQKYGTPERWTGKWLVGEIGGNAISTIGSVILGVATTAVTKNPVLGLSVGMSNTFMQESGSFYSQAKEEGASEADAQNGAVAVGTINSFIETIPLGRALSKFDSSGNIKKKLLSRISGFILKKVKNSTFEGSTETVQEIVSNAMKKTYKEDTKLFENTPESFAIGFSLGIIGDLTTDPITSNIEVVSPRKVEETNEIIDEALNTPKEERTPEQQQVVDSVNEKLDSMDVSEPQETVEEKDEKKATKVEETKAPADRADNVTKAPEPAKTIAKAETDPLIQEARKYKSAEEFVKNNDLIFQGGKPGTTSPFWSTKIGEANAYAAQKGLKDGEIRVARFSDLDPNITGGLSKQEWFAKYGSQIGGNKELNPKIITRVQADKTGLKGDSQLTDIWNQAQTDTISEADKKDFEDMGLKVPEDAKSTKTTTIPEAEKQIQDAYTASQDKVDQAFSEVFAEMEIAEAGKRIFLDQPDSSQRKVVGVKSTFPEWIPEDLRSRELFDAVMSGMSGDVTKLKFPDKNRTKQRQLYNEILAEVDKRSGVDTSEARSAILDLYEKPVQKQEAKQATKPADRSVTRRKETTAEEKLEKVKTFKNAEEFIASLSKEELASRAKKYKTPEEFIASFDEELNSIQFEELVDKQQAQAELDPEDIRIAEKVSMENLREIFRRFFPNVAEFYKEDGIRNVDDYLENIDSEIIAMEIDSDRIGNESFIRLLGDDELAWEMDKSNIIDLYKQKLLTPSLTKKAFNVKDQKFEDIPVNRESKFYETSLPQQNADIKKIYEVATSRASKANQAEVVKARKELFLAWATNKDVANQLGVTPAELNKKIRTYTGASVASMETQNRLNSGVPDQFKWTGITNSNFIFKNNLPIESVDKVVNSVRVKVDKNSWSSQSGESLRRYIMNTFLSIDTRLNYSDLNFDVGTLDRALGQYSHKELLITIATGSQNTVAHEIGHYLDYRFSRELGVSIGSLSDGSINFEYLQEKYNLADEHIAWAKEYIEFVRNLQELGDVGYTADRNEYLQKPTEVFARFTAKFVDWVATQSGYNHSDLNFYSDKFSARDYQNFIKLLQKKAEIDTKYNIKPLVGGEGSPINASMSPDAKQLEIAKIKSRLAEIYNNNNAVKAPAKSEQGLPVGQGKQKESAFLERVKEQLLSTDPTSFEFDEQTGKYNEMNLEENAQRATDFIVSNPKEAIAVSLGLINPPQGVTANAIGLGTMLKARDEKNFNLYRDIATSVTLRSTRLGQEIVSLRGQMNDNSPENFVKRAINARMKNISKSLLKDVEIAGRSLSDTKKEVTKKIDEETVKLKKKLSKDKIKIQKAQDIIDALRC